MQKTNLIIKKKNEEILETQQTQHMNNKKKFFTLFTTKNGIKIQNFNTQILNKAQQTRTKGSNVNYQYRIQFTNSLFIQQ